MLPDFLMMMGCSFRLGQFFLTVEFCNSTSLERVLKSFLEEHTDGDGARAIAQPIMAGRPYSTNTLLEGNG
jgi:hypothetical protein